MYTYGPVPSRRLGRSLGVSLIPAKTCSYSCVYCQLGRTSRVRTMRESFFPKEDILAEITAAVEKDRPEVITFVGDGEPTLSKDLGWLADRCKAAWEIPVAVITNGSLIFLREVRESLNRVDIVLPSLDAASEQTFRKINRPHHDITLAKVVDGLMRFRSEFAGQIWLEVMLVKGLNDTDESLSALGATIARIRPDRIYIVVPIRPPAEKWVEPPSPATILKAQHILGGAESIASLENGDFGLSEFSNAEQAIQEIGSRHPLRHEQALRIEAAFDAGGTVAQLLAEGALVEVEYGGNRYVLPGRFVRG